MKRFASIFLVSILAICLITGCARGMQYVIDHEEHFSGVVETVSSSYVIVNVNEEDTLHESFPVIYVKLPVEQPDSYTDLKTGDEVIVYYDSIVSGVHPKTNTTYAITLQTPAYVS